MAFVGVERLRPSAAYRSSLAPACGLPLRSGRRSSDMAFVGVERLRPSAAYRSSLALTLVFSYLAAARSLTGSELRKAYQP